MLFMASITACKVCKLNLGSRNYFWKPPIAPGGSYRLSKHFGFCIQHQKAKEDSFLDDLTGLYNQKYMAISLENEIHRCSRENKKPLLDWNSEAISYTTWKFRKNSSSSSCSMSSKLMSSFSKTIWRHPSPGAHHPVICPGSAQFIRSLGRWWYLLEDLIRIT